VKRFLFLDIDGVLAGDDEWDTLLKDNYCPFNKEALSNLEYILNEFPDTSIVISSYWRIGKNIKKLQSIFKNRKFKYYKNIVEKTRTLEFTSSTSSYHISVPRGCEIEEYIQTHTSTIDTYKYVILDDGSDMLYYQKDNFVHTRDHLLTLEDAKKAIDILQ